MEIGVRTPFPRICASRNRERVAFGRDPRWALASRQNRAFVEVKGGRRKRWSRLSRLGEPPSRSCPAGAPRILVLAPTRELATQVTQAVRKHGRFLRLSSADIVGGMRLSARLYLR